MSDDCAGGDSGAGSYDAPAAADSSCLQSDNNCSDVSNALTTLDDAIGFVDRAESATAGAEGFSSSTSRAVHVPSSDEYIGTSNYERPTEYSWDDDYSRQNNIGRSRPTGPSIIGSLVIALIFIVIIVLFMI